MGTQNYLEKQNPAQGGGGSWGGAELILPRLRISRVSVRNGLGSGTRRRWHPARPETRGAESACDGTPTSSRTNLTCKRKEELAQVPPGPIWNRAEPRCPGELRLPGSKSPDVEQRRGSSPSNPGPAGTWAQPVRAGAAPGPGALWEPPTPRGRRPAQQEHELQP